MTTESYPAVVMFNDDPDKRGIIRVACAGLMGDEDTEIPIDVEPVQEWGWFSVPDVGEIVEVEVITGSEEDESFGQASIDNLDLKWRGKRYYTDGEDDNVEPTKVHNDFVATNYAKRRGFSTPFGHIIMFDDTEGDPRMFISLQTEKLKQGEAPDPEKISRIELEPNGNFKITLLKKHTLIIDVEEPSIEVSLDDGKHIFRMAASAPSFEVLLDSGDTMGVSGKDGDTTTVLGDGAVKAAIADHMESLWGDLVSYLDGHTHLYNEISVAGGSGAPAVGIPIPTETQAPSQSAPTWDGNINSQKLTFPDN